MNCLDMLCHLVTAVLRRRIYKPKKIFLVVDSECTIAAVESQETVLQPYSNRVVEVEEHWRGFKRASIKVCPLQHTPGTENIADLASRGLATSKDMTERYKLSHLTKVGVAHIAELPQPTGVSQIHCWFKYQFLSENLQNLVFSNLC